eukprot:scaffold4639_cov117-Isochrysis_galbana.AAC.2
MGLAWSDGVYATRITRPGPPRVYHRCPRPPLCSQAHAFRATTWDQLRARASGWPRFLSLEGYRPSRNAKAQLAIRTL